jgi:hypothetical protein
MLWLMLIVAAWFGVRRLRSWRHESEPPFWRREHDSLHAIRLAEAVSVIGMGPLALLGCSRRALKAAAIEGNI